MNKPIEIYCDDFRLNEEMEDVLIYQIWQIAGHLTPDSPYIRAYNYGKKGDVCLVVAMDDDWDLCATVDRWDPERNFGCGGWETVVDADGVYYYSKDKSAMREFLRELINLWEMDYED